MSSGSMMSNVGNRQLYEDGDQRPHGHGGGPAPGGKQWQNVQDVEDTRSELTMQNRQKRAEKLAHEAQRKAPAETVKNPLEPALRQGHQPSRGAQVDAELQAEDEANRAKKIHEKGQWGPNVNDA